MLRAGWLGLALLALIPTLPLFAQPEDPAAGGNAEGLRAVMDVEQTLLAADRGRYEALVRQRAEADERIERIHHSLDAAIRDDEAPDSKRLIQLVEQLQADAADRETLMTTQRIVVERIGERLQRLVLFEEQIEQLQTQDQRTEGMLSGVWDITLMPIDQAGTCVLQQSGAVVTGTYQLEGGWTGSLQGTLVNRKVFLVRIDSRLGKSMELEGYLSADGRRIRGSWLNYELAGSEGATGQWSARRRTERR